MNKTICVIGLGYIGLPTASLLGTKGYRVTGVDTSSRVVKTINDGNVHIVEPDLDILVKSAVQSGHLRAVSKPEPADVYIIAVPTPLAADTKRPDVSYVEAAARSIAPLVGPGDLVLLESTVPVGTTEGVVLPILRAEARDGGRGVHLAHCPERVLPGRVLAELVDNDRIIGGVDAASADAAAAFYNEFVSGQVYKTDAATAEMAKLAENTFRDVNIALANELSIICDQHGVNPWAMIELANRHPRVDILQPGPGVGGHCIAVDPWFIADSAPADARLIRTAREVNDGKPDWVLAKVRDAVAGMASPVIACLGLAFKADVDDLRGSPALDIVRRLAEEGIARIVVCEPNLTAHPDLQLEPLASALAQANVVLLLVDHKPFRDLTLDQLEGKIVIDTRGVIR
ncbi:MAG: UDP-N-acetyl-D-mannosamine dehydrogenase [Alphaproteobacteria bacterium]|nr:UDP-N-acetyl-D-mannosamine dehydrogenase [Alphaproteobacteria bacterium]